MKRSERRAGKNGAGPRLRSGVAADIPECRPSSWGELVDVLFADSFDKDLGRHRSPFIFRGTTQDWPLSPSLHRMQHPRDLVPNIEKALVRSFKKYAYHEVNGVISDWKWLSIAQHHGLPTRLLDWTFSPFVALHFATDRLESMALDGVVWMVDFTKCRQALPPPLREALHDSFAWNFSVEMLEERFPRIQALEEMKGSYPEFVVFFEPPSLDPRIVNQFGLFSLMNRPHADLTLWLQRRGGELPGIARRVVIASDLKWEIRDKLDQMNLTERVIYPGLDGLSQWLKRWYSPANPKPAPGAPGRPPRSRAAKRVSSSG
jgi:hypothetical protein